MTISPSVSSSSSSNHSKHNRDAMRRALHASLHDVLVDVEQGNGKGGGSGGDGGMVVTGGRSGGLTDSQILAGGGSNNAAAAAAAAAAARAVQQTPYHGSVNHPSLLLGGRGGVGDRSFDAPLLPSCHQSLFSQSIGLPLPGAAAAAAAAVAAQQQQHIPTHLHGHRRGENGGGQGQPGASCGGLNSARSSATEGLLLSAAAAASAAAAVAATAEEKILDQARAVLLRRQIAEESNRILRNSYATTARIAEAKEQILHGTSSTSASYPALGRSPGGPGGAGTVGIMSGVHSAAGILAAAAAAGARSGGALSKPFSIGGPVTTIHHAQPSSTVSMSSSSSSSSTAKGNPNALEALGSNLRKKTDPYIDVSNLDGPNPDDPTLRRTRGGVSEPFPEKLHRMLKEVEEDGKSDVVSFYSHGRAFGVHDMDRFTNDIMPKYFKQTKWNSFARQLNLYGFIRITSGPDAGGYYHELFLKGKPNLSMHMRRVGVPRGDDRRKLRSKNATVDPDFYSMKAVQND